jgi:hypothetical protein
MRTFVIINGKKMRTIEAKNMEEARTRAINTCDHSKEIIVREIKEEEEKAVWIDEGHKDGQQVYKTKKKALKVIKNILKGDEDRLRGRKVEDISEDDIIEYGQNFYSIFKEQ